MYEEFHKIDAKKRERIINAALSEFAERGYDHASTNRIVEAAGISKGILFHYFGSKLGLFQYLYNHSIDVTLPSVLNENNLSEPDLFFRIRKMSESKLMLLSKYPMIAEFMKKAYLEPPSDHKLEIEKKNAELIQKTKQDLFKDFDTSLFRNDIPVDKAVNIILWCMQAQSEQLLLMMQKTGGKFTLEQAFVEIYTYLDILKQAFYK